MSRRLVFLSFFSTRFSFNDFSGFFLAAFFESIPLAITISFAEAVGEQDLVNTHGGAEIKPINDTFQSVASGVAKYIFSR